jgi:iron complex transport system permease protein
MIAQDVGLRIRKNDRFPHWPVIGGLVCLLVLVGFAALGAGAVQLSWAQIIDVFAKYLGFTSRELSLSRQEEIVLVSIRLPRIVAGMVIGAALALAGVATQGLFRNPLADPGLIGVSSGSALGAVVAIVAHTKVRMFLPEISGIGLPMLTAFIGGLLVSIIVHQGSLRQNQPSMSRMLLVGIAVNALCSAITGWLTFQASEAQLRSITFWSLGSLANLNWNITLILLAVSLPAAVMVVRCAQPLNVLLLGEAEAHHLGINVKYLKQTVVIATALLVGSSVAAVGMIAFVGLVVPHLGRLLVGPHHRILFPVAALIGAVLLPAADILARTVIAPAELPIGIVTAVMGAPFFLWLIWKNDRGL